MLEFFLNTEILHQKFEVFKGNINGGRHENYGSLEYVQRSQWCGGAVYSKAHGTQWCCVVSGAVLGSVLRGTWYSVVLCSEWCSVVSGAV